MKEVFYLARQRVRQLNSNFRDIVETGNTEAVHDFRKATRRLQSIVDISGLQRHPGRAKKLHRELQDFRQAAGEWRDSDVILHELKQMQGRDRAARDCWQILSKRIEEQRDRNANRFVQRQKARAVKRLGSKAKAFVKHGLQSKSLSNNVARFLERAWLKWNRAIDEFATNNSPISLHAFRTKSKGLRYAIELSLCFYPDR